MITIVIVEKNRLSHLIMCIKSIKEQTDKRFNYLVIDNGSNNDTINWLINNNIPYEICTNGHIAACRNLGISLSRTKYIFYLDGDCIIPKDYVETLYKYIEFINDDHAILYSRRRFIDYYDADALIHFNFNRDLSFELNHSLMYLFKTDRIHEIHPESTVGIYRFSDIELYGTHSVLFPRQDLIDIGGFYEFFDQPNTIRGEDWEILNRLYLLGNHLYMIRGLNSYHINHEVHTDNLIGNKVFDEVLRSDGHLYREGINLNG